MAASDRIPEYLTGSHQLTSTVVFTALFSLVFTLLISPYLRYVWFRLGFASPQALLTLVFMSFSLIILAVSKMLMFAYCKNTSFLFYSTYSGVLERRF